MNAHSTRTGNLDEARSAGTKFTYASGSTPLDGYTIKRGIGRGGFGEVYFASSDAGKEVALKLIRRNLDVELRGVRQCLNVNHPNLIGIHDIRTDESGDCWVVMEHVSGESLDEAIERNPNGIPISQVLAWMHGIAAGVAYLHDRGVVHRDLKPGNIFSDEGIVKIGDYGLSKFISCSRRSGQTESVGTVHYMAPEIANGRYGREIDMYALGVILYEMLTGRVPFEGESVGEVLMKHLTAEPDLSLLEPPYRNLVARAMAKDPEKRIKTAGELVAAMPPIPPGDTPAAAVAAVPPRLSTDAEPPPEAGRREDVRRVTNDEVLTQEEPLYRIVRVGLGNMAQEWSEANLPPGFKAAVVVGAILLLVSTAKLWGPFLGVVLPTYGGYWIVRTLILSSKSRCASRRARATALEDPPAGTRPSSEQAEAGMGRHANARRHRRRAPRWRHHEVPMLCRKTSKQRFTELTGSMLMATAVVVIMSLVMMILSGRLMEVEQFVWMALVGTIGSWAVMLPSKGWEGRPADQASRRFVMLVAGLVIGAVACGLAHGLMVELPHDADFGIARHPISTNFYDVAGAPKVMAFLAYFGFLFVALRWWRQVDPMRGFRLSIWSTGCCVFCAWALSLFWAFPQPWGLMVAAVISIAVQLASPWLNADERQQARLET